MPKLFAANRVPDAVKSKNMEIIEAENHRESIIELLSAKKLPVGDLPAKLENFLIARDEKKIAGVAGLEIYGDYGLLRSVAVGNDFRNKGIAGKLLMQIEVLAASKGLREIYLLTETAPDYFDRKEYKRIARAEVPAEVQQSSEFSHVCPQSAIVMKKILIK
jgi:amino-acid N-acetyltransferase